MKDFIIFALLIGILVMLFSLTFKTNEEVWEMPALKSINIDGMSVLDCYQARGIPLCDPITNKLTDCLIKETP